MCGLLCVLCPSLFTSHNVFKIQSCCSMYPYLILPFFLLKDFPVHGCTLPHHNTFLSWCTLCCFHLLAIVNSDAMNICIQVFVSVFVLNFRENIPRSGISSSYGKFRLNIFMYCQIAFQSGSTIFHSHQPFMRIPTSPYCEHLLLFFVVVLFFVFLLQPS